MTDRQMLVRVATNPRRTPVAQALFEAMIAKVEDAKAGRR